MRWWRRRLAKRRQRTFIWCPTCKDELCSQEPSGFSSDTDEGVLYHCTRCGTWSLWDFDVPVPLLRARYDNRPSQ